MDKWWNPEWTKIFFKIYIASSIICFLGVAFFWYSGPIEIAQIFALGLMWSIFGSLINRQGVI
jgi:hypothetical protein